MADDVFGSFSGHGRSRDWLYRKDGRLYGPLPTQVLLDKVRAGEIDGKTLLAPDGSDEFLPYDSYDDLKDEIPKALAQFDLRQKREATRRRAAIKQRLVALAVLVVASLIGGGVYAGAQWYRAEQHKRALELAEEQREEAARQKKLADDRKAREERERLEQEQKNKERLASATEPEIDLDMVPLVSVKKKSKTTTPGKKAPVEEGTEGCQLDQGELVSHFRTAFPLLKMCIKDQQKRGGDLPETVNMSFTIANAGNVSGFDMDDSGIKSGPFFDCMKKAVSGVKYPKFPGERCNVDYPITIGKKK